MRKQIITITGDLGAGKSSTAKRLASELHYEHFSSGDLFRAIAVERGVSIEEINKTAELESEIDRAVDERLRHLYEGNHLVIDSRLAYHWMPDSFKVFLKLSPYTAADRIWQQIQSTGRMSQQATSKEELLKATEARRESERKRYWNLYKIDPTDPSQFDLVINTAEHDLANVTQMIKEAYAAWLPS